jgi:phospholipid/cholesterol/gamma-HCH transport system substrate-binding protein
LKLGQVNFGLALITGRSGPASEYLVQYRNVTGLRYGAPVFYEGYRIGDVGAIQPQRSAAGTRYKVTLVVKRDWQIPKDSVAHLQSSGLLADMSIGIKEGASREMLAAGAEIRSAESADVFAAFSELAGEVSNLTRDQITPMVSSFPCAWNQSPAHWMTMRRKSLVRPRPCSTSSTAHPRQWVTCSNGKPGSVAGILGNVQGLSGELRETRKTLDQTVGELADIARENRGDIRGSITDLATVMASLSSRMDVITHHLESATRNLDEFSREIRRNPGQLLRSPEPDKLEEDGQ